MESMPGRLLNAIADATIGTAIVLLHVMLADRARHHSIHRDLRTAKHGPPVQHARA